MPLSPPAAGGGIFPLLFRRRKAVPSGTGRLNAVFSGVRAHRGLPSGGAAAGGLS